MGEEGVEGLQILGQRGGLILGEGTIFHENICKNLLSDKL